MPFDKEIQHLTNARSDIAHQKYKSQVLMDVCESLNTEVNDLTQRLENMELNNAKRMVIFSGLQPPSTKKDDLVLFVEQFIHDYLQEQIQVEDAYCVGLNNSVVVEFQSARDRRLILQIKARLKEYRNNDGSKVYINEFTPLATQERKRRERDIKYAISTDPSMKNITVEYTRAGLTIQGKPYRKNIIPPTPKELVDLSVEEIDKLMKLKSLKSREFTQQGSVFRAYTIDAKAYQDVRDFYRKLKLVHPNSRHIPCAYILPNAGPSYESSDYHDDGEPGSGRVLLNFLQSRNIQNASLFVVRRYGGVKLGADRFNLYEEAARSILDPQDQLINAARAKTPNPPNQQNNTPQDEDLTAAKEVTSQQVNRRSYYPKRGYNQRRGTFPHYTARRNTQFGHVPYRPPYPYAFSDQTGRQRGQQPVRQARPSTQRRNQRYPEYRTPDHGPVSYQDVLNQSHPQWSTHDW